MIYLCLLVFGIMGSDLDRARLPDLVIGIKLINLDLCSAANVFRRSSNNRATVVCFSSTKRLEGSDTTHLGFNASPSKAAVANPTHLPSRKAQKITPCCPITDFVRVVIIEPRLLNIYCNTTLFSLMFKSPKFRMSIFSPIQNICNCGINVLLSCQKILCMKRKSSSISLSGMLLRFSQTSFAGMTLALNLNPLSDVSVLGFLCTCKRINIAPSIIIQVV